MISGPAGDPATEEIEDIDQTQPADPTDPLEETDPAAPVLVVPPELVLDDAAHLRLEGQLAVAPEDVVGVAASVCAIPPGSSAKTAAERAAMAPLDRPLETEARQIDGAILLRPGVDFELSPTQVKLRGRVLVDPGAIAYDPWAPQTEPAAASPDGRPPFRWRPVVLFLGLEPDLDLAETARGLANGLLVRDVEARLAVPAVPDGFYLTRPCRPAAETVRALAPDVVIAVDPTALDVASSWCGTSRSATVVELTQDISYDIQLVSWRIGVAQGRLRARIGRAVGTTELAQLVNRLCSGPQPLPPPRSHGTPRRDALGVERAVAISLRRAPTPQRSAPATVVAVTGPSAAGPPVHMRTMLDALVAAGSAVHRGPIDMLDPTAIDTAGLVLVSSSAGAEAIAEVAARRSGDGRPTLLDVEPTDAVDPAALGDEPLELLNGLEASAITGFAVAPSLPLAAEIRSWGQRVQVVPHLVGQVQISALEQAAEERTAPDAPVIGWRIGRVGPVQPLMLGALTEMAGSLLDAGVRLEVVGSPERVPAGLSDHAGVVVRDREPTPVELAQWAVQIWTPPTRWAEVSGDVRGMVEAGFAGVPTLIGAPDRQGLAGQMDLNLVVEEFDRATAWEEAVRRLFDEHDRAARGARAREASHAIYGPDANLLRVARLMGWLGLVRGR